MNRHALPDRPHTDRLHPRVYRLMLTMVGLYLLAAWLGFAASSYVDYLLAIVTGFLILVVSQSLIAWRQWWTHPTRHRHDLPPDTYHDWAEQDVDTFTGSTPGREVAIEILLPLGAVAFGMLAFAILTQAMR